MGKAALELAKPLNLRMIPCRLIRPLKPMAVAIVQRLRDGEVCLVQDEDRLRDRRFWRAANKG